MKMSDRLFSRKECSTGDPASGPAVDAMHLDRRTRVAVFADGRKKDSEVRIGDL
jgi:hypothetical protein